MSGSGPIYEYQRELTAKLEQVMRERDEARAEASRLDDEAIYQRGLYESARAEVERLRADKDRLHGILRDIEYDKDKVAERQREACEKYAFCQACANAVGSAALVTEGDK